jgi:DNA-binding response OmpR family regulator
MATVLVVEDDSTLSAFISISLQNEGFEVIAAKTSVAAKEAISSQIFDLIWLDLVLPDGNGYSLCRYLQKNDKTKDIPIIICSSKDGEIDKEWGVKQGASAYLTKPIEPETIVQTVRSLIR